MDALISSVSFLAFLFLVLHVAWRRTALFLITFVFLFAFTFRVVNFFYIDVFGPVESSQLGRPLGPGHASLPLVIAYVLVIACYLITFTRSRFQKWARLSEGGPLHSASSMKIQNLAFYALAMFLLVLS